MTSYTQDIIIQELEKAPDGLTRQQLAARLDRDIATISNSLRGLVRHKIVVTRKADATFAKIYQVV